MKKIYLVVILVILTAFLVQCSPTLKDIQGMSNDEIWQEVNWAVAYDTDLILRRQAVLNEKLDRIIELLERR